jgi:hypothetical protein
MEDKIDSESLSLELTVHTISIGACRVDKLAVAKVSNKRI